MAAQETISARRLQGRVGQRLRVLVDEVRGSRAIARSAFDAPEIDGLVRIGRAHGLSVGDWAEVEIVSADVHDLQAVRIAAG